MREPNDFTAKIGQIVAHLARECQTAGIPYTRDQLQECVMTLTQLWTKVGEEQALVVFDQLVKESIGRVYPWGWIGTELRFELLAHLVGSRRKAALNMLQQQDGSNASLDTYNERVNRFT